MTLTTRRLTYDDLRETPDDLNRYEIIDGELVVSPAPILDHQRVARHIFRLLDHASMTASGEVFFAPVDVELDLHDVFEPDVLYVSAERRDIKRHGRIVGAPDLVVEVLSPSSGHRDRVQKLEVYARADVREYWLADPEARTLTIYANHGGTMSPVAPDDEGRITSAVLPGLVIDPEVVFSHQSRPESSRTADDPQESLP